MIKRSLEKQFEKSIIINDKEYELGRSNKMDEELMFLSNLAKKEATHWQWEK